ncbi:hypothetical protein CGLO_15178 [Colletotrichum gloeosporioides Cg-14]|uniref:Uncharacterized protein n=1 Tax=Colletotrichum gloeosporioides (strain Cg-14) TaxID=1237896 RepID=T0L2J7_COLGC|nr:hypothetical protein CGLO_15178 [Colletotrichum gloeosporioides Cg-14]
MPLSYLGDI